MRDRLKGKVAIVTGAGSSPREGIGNGKGAAVLYVREGAENAIMPGLIETPWIDRLKAAHGGNWERMKKERAERVPMKKMGEAWDIAYASLFLVSDEAKYITGQVLAVDGGYLCKG